MKKKVKFMQTCCNGDGRPVQAPSKVLCAECLAGLSEKMNNLVMCYQHTGPRSKDCPACQSTAKGGQHVNEPGVGPMARLKQENRDLKARIDKLVAAREQAGALLVKLKAENARLKTENENARDRILYHSGGWEE